MLGALPSFANHSDRPADFDQATFAGNFSVRVPEDQTAQGPLRGADRYLLVADARLDDREALIEKLGRSTEAARLSDAEILLRAWTRWGEDSLQRLVGDFAFGLYDRTEQSLFLARDATGQRPLFYARHGPTVLFASLPGGILRAGLRDLDFDREWLAKKLLGFADIGPGTCFGSILRVQPGHVVRLTAAGAESRQYWQPSPTRLHRSTAEFVEDYDELLTKAVSARLRRTDGPLAVHLSSGFDSNAVASTAARLDRDKPLIAFTAAPRAGFDGPVPAGWMADETSLAAEAARKYGLKHEIVRSSGHPLSLLRKQSLLYQEPDRNVINMDWWTAILRSARDHGAKVLLTGTMGNLTLHWGGLPVLADWFRTEGAFRWIRQAEAARRSLGARWSGILINSFGSRVPANVGQVLGQAFRNEPPPRESTFVRPELLKSCGRFAREHRRDFDTGDVNRNRLAVLHSQDRGLFNLGALIETGVDERDPMADQRIMDFSFALPPDQLLDNGISRPLMRRALADRLPQDLFDNRARGLQGADWYEQLRPKEIEEIIEEVSGSACVNELVDLERLRGVLNSLPPSDPSSAYSTSVYRRSLTLTLSTAVFIDVFEKAVRERSANPFSCS